MLLKDINDYLRGGMLTLGGIAVAIMVVILLVLFNVRWRLLPLAVILIGVIWAFGLAGYLGIPLTLVTIAGLPVMLGVGIDYAIQMHARVEEEVVIDRADAPDPGDRPQPRARAAGRHVRRHLRLRRPALRQGADDPRLRPAARRRHRRHLPLLDHPRRSPSSASASTSRPTKGRDFREGPLGRLVVRLGSSRRGAPIPLAVASVVIFVGGHRRRGQAQLQTDPMQWVNQDSQIIKDIHRSSDETGSSSELGVFVHDATTCSPTSSSTFVARLHRATRCAKYADEAAHRLEHRDRGRRHLIDVPGRARRSRRPASDVKARLRRRAARHQALDRQRRTAPRSTSSSAPAPARSRSGRPVVRRHPRQRRTRPTGITATPSGLAVVGVGLLENLEANRILLTYLAIAVRVPLPRGAAALGRPVAAVAGAGAHRGRRSRRSSPGPSASKLSPMTAVGGPLVVAACTEFTSLILLRFVEERRRGLEPQRGGRRRRARAPAGRSSCPA